MSTNTAPKFGKVELLFKNGETTKDLTSTTRLEFDDCGLMITGDHIIVILDERDEINNTLTSTGRIFNLRDIAAYKTHAQ
ncbi:MAG: hypothetical protein E6R13_00300 [Spirochaetes bacterium]|nr:MAG: hypothetical protein E6R13_00300 [Spirochaetota bacterium]